jgi:hypothetical protein
MNRHFYTMTVIVTMAWAAVEPASRAAVLQIDDFSTTAENWTTRDGELAVAQDAFGGGVLSGTFGVANPGDVVTDAFRLSTLSAFPGLILTAFSFDFYSVTMLPSDLIFRFGNGSTTYFRSLALGGVGSWGTYSVNLNSQAGWLGGAPSSFTNVLTTATFYDIQLTQNGTAGQTFYLDNFQIEGEEPGNFGPPAAVPEPGTLSLFFLALVVLFAVRRRRCRPLGLAVQVVLAGVVTGTVVMAESFDHDVAGWRRAESGAMMVVHQSGGNLDGSLAGKFAAQQDAYPQAGSFVAPDSFITTAFGGGSDVRAAYLGFDVMASTTVPASFRVRIGDGSGREVSCFLRALMDEVGRWYSFRLSLASPEAGRWDGDLAYFDDILDNVATISIDISRNGEEAQSFALDNVFVHALPDSGVSGESGGVTSFIWQNLRPGETYRVEGSASLNPAAWHYVESFTASGSEQITRQSGSIDHRFFRLVMP